MKRIDSVAENMSRGLIYLHPKNKLVTAFRLMNDHKIKHIPVIEKDRIVGIVSDRDILLHLKLETNGADEKLDIPDLYIEDICSAELITCTPFHGVSEAAELMLFHEIDSLPVVGKGNKLLGIITSSDLLKYIANEDDNYSNQKIEDILRKIPINHDFAAYC